MRVVNMSYIILKVSPFVKCLDPKMFERPCNIALIVEPSKDNELYPLFLVAES